MRSRDTRLTLVSPIKRHHQPPVSLSEWMSGREMCFIQCARRKHVKGYIAVVQNGIFGDYETCCVHSKRNEDEVTSFMLFQTVRTLETRTDKAITLADESDCHEFPSQIPVTAHQLLQYSSASVTVDSVRMPLCPTLEQPLRSSPIKHAYRLRQAPRADLLGTKVGEIDCYDSPSQIPVTTYQVPGSIPMRFPPEPVPIQRPQPTQGSSPIRLASPLPRTPRADLLLHAEATGTEDKAEYESMYGSDIYDADESD